MNRLHCQSLTILADTETPVSAFLKLCRSQAPAFLFESGETKEHLHRHSIVAWEPLAALRLDQDGACLEREGQSLRRPAGEFFDLARQLQQELACPDLPGLPFVGALVGYLGYDLVRLLERLPPARPQSLPTARLYFPACFAVFDHLARELTLVALGEHPGRAAERLEAMQRRLAQPLAPPAAGGELEIVPPPPERFKAAVRRAKEYILAGDIFQVVLSDCFRGRARLDPLSVYRWLRVKSPSPYMFYLDLGDTVLVGASPETLVKLEDRRVILRPIAGTRGRSSDPERDRDLERELLTSDKERAEHVMLVDLARNDAGRVCGYGSVEVAPYMEVERFSHVMHLTSQVQGRLRKGLDPWELLRAAFPAGTVSGAPKVRAMEIIDELEAAPRGTYAGAVGCIGPGRRMDTCIAIRMIQFQGDEFVLQAGAGIVADSDPEAEYREIQHKAAQGIAALRAAAEAAA